MSRKRVIVIILISIAIILLITSLFFDLLIDRVKEARSAIKNNISSAGVSIIITRPKGDYNEVFENEE